MCIWSIKESFKIDSKNYLSDVFIPLLGGEELLRFFKESSNEKCYLSLSEGISSVLR